MKAYELKNILNNLTENQLQSDIRITDKDDFDTKILDTIEYDEETNRLMIYYIS